VTHPFALLQASCCACCSRSAPLRPPPRFTGSRLAPTTKQFPASCANCNAQANAALASERGINQDINATLGGNWQFSGTSAIEQQSMGAQAAGYADQVLNSCMRAKGFTKQS